MLRKVFAPLLAVVVLAVPGVAQAGALDQYFVPSTDCTSDAYPPNSSQSLAQEITAGATGQLDQVDLDLRSMNTPTSPLTVEIRNVPIPGSGPGSTILATGTVPVSSAPASHTFISIPLAPSAPVIAGTHYAIVAHSASTSNNGWLWCAEFTGGYAGGSDWYTGGPPALGSWSLFAPSTPDLGFKTYVTAAGAPQTLTVDDDKVQCPSAGYTTIQGAVDAAGPGDTINVCRGTYAEIVDIGAGKDDLSLVSSTATAAAVLQGLFRVNDGVTGVSIQKFRIEPIVSATGFSVFDDGTEVALIRNNLIVGGAYGITVSEGSITMARDNTFIGQNTTGIRVAASGGPSTVASATLQANTITGTPGSQGIVFEGAAGFGDASGSVFGNTVSKNGSDGIYVGTLVGGSVNVKANNVIRNGKGITLSSADGSKVENNKVSENTGTGISVDSNGVVLLSNNARGNGGLDCEDLGTGNTWTGNYGLDWNVPGICKK